MNVAGLKTYLKSVVGDLESILGIVDSTDYTQITEDTLYDYGFTDAYGNADADIALATDERKLRLLAKVNLWKFALGKAASKYNVSSDGATLSRSQLHAMCMENLKMALSDAAEFDPNAEIKIYEVHPTQTPYAYDPLRIER